MEAEGWRRGTGRGLLRPFHSLSTVLGRRSQCEILRASEERYLFDYRAPEACSVLSYRLAPSSTGFAENAGAEEASRPAVLVSHPNGLRIGFRIVSRDIDLFIAQGRGFSVTSKELLHLS